MNDVNDRGAKKWNRLMIPEFKENLKNIYNNNNNDSKTEEEINKIKHVILLTAGNNTRVAISYNTTGTVYEICGYILKWNHKKEVVSIIDDYGDIKELKLTSIQSVNITG
ncbi:hypothetical protein SYNTR_0757 [Candidatus Syntrophocurvum alkaliphilum]|uniref:YolD-like protein n=1 Tax=Candidatus Syntrophocurvum alkaliphilum TaxID=2293317 RepID=A0A6I6DG02_9FIRM|nr:YolD-like family protein [Candidatus Syntrophocurvum alkaliphilum]QGT99350.1 hypothetical protein SYNTR_0757 [Candidatus Syntrophocurvum alkaliphilum]